MGRGDGRRMAKDVEWEGEMGDGKREKIKNGRVSLIPCVINLFYYLVNRWGSFSKFYGRFR